MAHLWAALMPEHAAVRRLNQAIHVGEAPVDSVPQMPCGIEPVGTNFLAFLQIWTSFLFSVVYV